MLKKKYLIIFCVLAVFSALLGIGIRMSEYGYLSVFGESHYNYTRDAGDRVRSMLSQYYSEKEILEYLQVDYNLTEAEIKDAIREEDPDWIRLVKKRASTEMNRNHYGKRGLQEVLEKAGFTDEEVQTAMKEYEDHDWDSEYIEFIACESNNYGLSRSMLKFSLESNGFTSQQVKDALEYAEENVDWKKEAYIIVRQDSIYSGKDDLKNSLVRGGFTDEEIDYAMNKQFGGAK